MSFCIWLISLSVMSSRSIHVRNGRISFLWLNNIPLVCILVYIYIYICHTGPPWQLSWSRIHLQCRRPQFNSWVGKILWRRDRLSTPLFLDFPCGSAGKESACNAGDQGLIPGLGRSPEEGKGYPLRYSGLENSMDYIAHGVAESRAQLSNLHFHFLYATFSLSIYLSIST